MLAKTRFAALFLLSAAAGCGGAETLDFGDTVGGNGGRGGEGGTAAGGSGGVGAQGGSGGVGAQGGSGGVGAQGGGGSGGAPPSCGDGVANGQEACDGADLGGASCQDYGFSTAAGLTCTGSCLIDASGCEATCDGALLEAGEECDGADLGDHDCTDLGFVTPAGAACVGCVVDYSMCAAACGNGAIEGDEVCDGAALGMASCVDFGFVAPAGLKCNGACDDVDPSGCAAACNGALEPGETCDGMDLDGHDCTELGFTNPIGMVCTACMLDGAGCAPTCGNGDKEPGEQCDDGNTASGDGCSSMCTLGGTSCNDAIAVSLDLGAQAFTGTTAGGGLAASACASAAPNRVYAVTVAATGFLTATLTRSGTAYPSVLHARTTCGDAATTILCADSVDPDGSSVLNGGEVVSFPVSANQTVYLFVDGATAADTGNYELVLDLSAGTNCQDPVPIVLEKGSPMTLLGLTNGKTQSTGGSCGGGAQGFGASDVVYDVNFVDATTNVTAALSAAGTNYNSVLYARGTCDSGFSQYTCDNPGGNGGESISFDPNDDDTTFVWVDGNNGAEGAFTLVLTPPAP